LLARIVVTMPAEALAVLPDELLDAIAEHASGLGRARP